VNLADPCLIWLGSEGGGLDRNISDYADELISIPMHAPVESLNIAVAAALLVYEASNQRNRDPSISGREGRSA
jgi:TrmH family RNA methyltransferase